MTQEDEQRGPLARIRRATLLGARTSFGTIWFLLRIMVPISLLVALLDWSGFLAILAKLLAPAMGLLGLPGEGALVLLSGMLLNNYSAIAVAGTLSLDLREATILAMMCLTAHNLLVETAVMKKTGSSALKMVALRVGMALVAALVFNLLLPHSLAEKAFSGAAAGGRLEFLPMLAAWALSTGKLVLKIVLLVLLIMIGQRLLEEFRIAELLSRLFAPLMKVFGLPASSSLLWIVINIVGYAYGAGIVVEQVDRGKMKPQEADLFNHHAAISHSLFEDTALYVAVGIPILWITLPRIIFSAIVVWVERIRRHYFRRSFRAGVA